MRTGLGTRIAAGYEGPRASAFVETMIIWRDMARRALGHSVADRECICPRCGRRHGLAPVTGDF